MVCIYIRVYLNMSAGSPRNPPHSPRLTYQGVRVDPGLTLRRVNPQG